MSIKIVQPEIERFLSAEEAGVLVITGKWGVGKTFAWNRYLKEARDHSKVTAAHYAYVSLFGLGNLEELKAAIFQNTIRKEDIGKSADLQTLDDMVKAAPTLWRKAGAVARLFPGADKYLSTFERVGFFWVKEQIVCIDDLERKSDDLSIRDVLGLVSHLREQRSCKVVLLLNDEKFGPDDDAEFRGQLEKVADTTLRFNPTPDEAAEIGVDQETPFHRELRRFVVALGIVNIRTIKKIERLATRLEEELLEFDQRVLVQAIQSAVLFGFTKYQPDDSPTFQFLRELNTYEALVAQEEGAEDPRAPAWRATLNEYGFSAMDEFDLVILRVVEAGHLDSAALHAEAQKLHERFLATDEDQSYREAWKLYHGSFGDNSKEVMEAMAAAVAHTPRSISPMNLSGSIGLLKDLGWGGNINQLIETYIDGHNDEPPAFWDLNDTAFGDDVRDLDVRAAFAAKLASLQEVKNPAQTLIELGREKSWSDDNVAFLATVAANDLYAIFKELAGDDLNRAVGGALFFRNVANPTDPMKALTQNAVAALRQIAAESPINRRRVLQRGLSANDLNPPAAAAPAGG